MEMATETLSSIQTLLSILVIEHSYIKDIQLTVSFNNDTFSIVDIYACSPEENQTKGKSEKVKEISNG